MNQVTDEQLKWIRSPASTLDPGRLLIPVPHNSVGQEGLIRKNSRYLLGQKQNYGIRLGKVTSKQFVRW